jgi:hypothetical protein
VTDLYRYGRKIFQNANCATSMGETSTAPSARAAAGRIRAPKKASRSAGLKPWREIGGATFALIALEAVPKHASSSSSQHTDGL